MSPLPAEEMQPASLSNHTTTTEVKADNARAHLACFHDKNDKKLLFIRDNKPTVTLFRPGYMHELYQR